MDAIIFIAVVTCYENVVEIRKEFLDYFQKKNHAWWKALRLSRTMIRR